MVLCGNSVLGKAKMAWGMPQASFYIVCLGSHLNPKHHRFDEGKNDRKYIPFPILILILHLLEKNLPKNFFYFFKLKLQNLLQKMTIKINK